jgi:O-antigen/teichoic acid export membrane protein
MSIRKNTLWNLLGSAGPMVLGLAAMPFILRSLGVERLGVLTLIWALIGYLSIFDFGLGRALTQKVAQLRAAGRSEEIPAAARSGLLLIAGTGALGAVLGALGFHLLGTQWLKISPALADEVSWSIYIAMASIPVATLTSGFKGVMEGFENFKAANIYKFILGTANFGSPLLAIAFWQGTLPAIVGLLILSRVLVLVLHAASVSRSIPRLWRTGAEAIRGNSGDLLRFGSWMTLSNVVSPLMVISDRFIISNLLGAAVVAYYTVPSDFMIRLLIIPAALTTSLFPVFSQKMGVPGGAVEAKGIYGNALRTVLQVMLPLLLALALVSHWGLKLWLGSDYADHSYQVAIVLALGILFNSLAQTPLAAIQAAGQPKLTSLIHLGEFAAYVPLTYVLTLHFGLIGAALAWSLRALADFSLLHSFAMQMFKKDRR